MDKLKSEGETIMPTTGKRGSDVSKALPPPVNVERYTHVPRTNISRRVLEDSLSVCGKPSCNCV